ncbi:hypothetical protein Acor_38980 [Acrocarpospora corrugata]|uniref:Uncharacterized protein n=1 Tax=Acrocarpospora corrugata TaxID=35763 RepID=A0A5M3W3G9_9ACTN|nr:hypothetical protein [Acrocarpospora corrugata]GES01833.1 hypothetical protein Acor_38980 [Acrocarpospora corrugata]
MATMMTKPGAEAAPVSAPSLDEDIAALFSLDPKAEPTVDLDGYGRTDGNCTDNGCTSTCQGC